MRIAHVTSYFHPAFYGSHEAFLTRELARRGHEVVLLTSDRMPRWGGSAGLEDNRLPRGEERWEGAVVRRFRAGPTVGFVPSLPGVARALLEEPYDLYLSHELFSLASYHAARAARRRSRPLVLVQHGYHGGRRWPYRILFRANLATTGRTVLRAADSVVALTERASRFLLGLGVEPDRIRVVPSGVDARVFHPPAREEGSAALRVGCVGRLEAPKGGETLVRAFAEAFPGGKETLLFAGEGSFRDALRRETEALGLADRCAFLGRLAHEAVSGFLRSVDALAVPTLHAEPFGLVAVEAAACGRPVVASAIGGLGEIVRDGETGLLVPPGDVPALARALRRLAVDPGLRQRLGRAARERALAVYDWPRIADAFERIFEEVALSGACRP